MSAPVDFGDLRGFVERVAAIREVRAAPGVPATMYHGADVQAVRAEAARLLEATARPDFLAVAREIVAPPSLQRPDAFARAKLAGYNVEPDDFGAWVARDPEGEEIHLEPGGRNWPTEREAWEACDHLRMFGSADQ